MGSNRQTCGVQRRGIRSPHRLIPTRPAAGVIAAVTVLGALGGCGGGSDGPSGITDPATEAVADTVPEWFPAFPAPAGGVIVEVIDRPDTGNSAIEIGRSVTWRIDRPFDDVLRDLDATLAGMRWQPTDRLATEEGEDTRRTRLYIENGEVEVITVYTDANLKGVRMTVELPA